LEEKMTKAEFGLEGANTTLIEHVPGAGIIVGGVHSLTGHKDEALRAYGRAANSTLPLVGGLAGNAVGSGLVTAGLIAPELVLPIAGICAVGGAVGSLGGYVMQRTCEWGVSEEAKSRDPSFCDAHNRTPLAVTTDVLVGAGSAAISGGLAKGVRRAMVPKWKAGEDYLAYKVKKHMTEGCVKAAVTEIPKVLTQQPDSASQTAEIGLNLVANIGVGGLSSAVGETAKISVLAHIDAVEPRAKALSKIGAATAKSAASASVRATKGIVSATYKTGQIDLVEPALDIVAEGSAGAINALGDNVKNNELLNAKPLLHKPVEKLSAATAQQVKKVVKRKAELDLATNLQTTLEDTVVRLANIEEKIETFGKGVGKDVACRVAARCVRTGQPEDSEEIAEPGLLIGGDMEITDQPENTKDIEMAEKFDESAVAESNLGTTSVLEITEHENFQGIEDASLDRANGLEIKEQTVDYVEVAEPNLHRASILETVSETTEEHANHFVVPSLDRASFTEIIEQKGEDAVEEESLAMQLQDVDRQIY